MRTSSIGKMHPLREVRLQLRSPGMLEHRRLGAPYLRSGDFGFGSRRSDLLRVQKLQSGVGQPVRDHVQEATDQLKPHRGVTLARRA